eukprot:m.31820 g.31820  ORF g.31820 m.31820 type:complete len:224 (-) comp9734_c2_seq2:69-740(-)
MISMSPLLRPLQSTPTFTPPVCSNGTRVFVSEKMSSAFIEEVVKQTQQLVVGDPFDENTVVGPLVGDEHAQRVHGFIKRATQEGAHIQCGGDLFKSASRDGQVDVFVTPCVLSSLSDDMEVVRDEVFGPVMSVLTYNDIDEVIQRANATQFGLAGGVLTTNLKLAHQITNKLRVGMAYVNTYNLAPPHLPWGGMKNSGLGRENGLQAVYEYSQVKSVCIDTST